VRFWKYHGIGNDFILLENLQGRANKDPAWVRTVCDRRFGIGADGILYLERSEKADAAMSILNSDGSVAEMCGNGIRCVAKHLYDQGIVRKKHMTIETLAGIKTIECTVTGDQVTDVKVGMGAAVPAYGTSLLDTALAASFTGAALALMASTGAQNPVNVLLRRGPLAFYGRISYGLYMIHIMAFIFIGWLDLRMAHYGTAGNLTVVAARFAVSTALASALWYGFESQILKLKRHF